MSAAHASGRRFRAAPGFSLIELTLVIVIMGVLMAVVTVNLVGQGQRAKAKATRASMRTIQMTLDQYQLEYSVYPPQLVELQKLRLLKDDAIRDGWSHEFYYKTPGASAPYELLSAGEDGEFGTSDDIDFWKAEQ